jgi:hypothetical protein
VNIQNTFSVIAGGLFIAGFFPYIRSILAGSTKPAKASWIIWASLDTITLAGMWAKQSLNGQIVGAVAGAWIIVALALKYGVPGWTKLDKFCLGGAILGIVLWAIFNSPIMGLVTSVSVVFIGSIPTFVSAWHDPGRENKVAWTIFWVSCVFAVLAIPKATFQDAMQPITFFLIESIMMYILYVKSRN